MRPLKKIVIIGPESTGKSTLCAALARQYRTAWVPEFARTYLLENGTSYHYGDLLTIARGQIAWEEEISAGLSGEDKDPSLLFIDTDMYVMKVWNEFVFGKCHDWILDQISVRKYDLYLLCNTDLPWTKDELREYPDLETRERLFHMYKDLLVHQSTPWIEIKGQQEERLVMAMDAVNRLG